MTHAQPAMSNVTPGTHLSQHSRHTSAADVHVLIEWTAATQPCDIVGIAPDGGFYVHASLHPFGAQAALDRSKDEGVEGRKHKGELYLPVPWIRSELSSMLKRGPVPAQLTTRARVTVIQRLNEILPELIEQADGVRRMARQGASRVDVLCESGELPNQNSARSAA